MKASSKISLGEIMVSNNTSVVPAKYPSEVFDLYSIPAFDTGEPEVVAGELIGSTKQLVQSGDVLLSKIVPHIRRSWVIGTPRGRRTIASGEWIVFRGARIYPRYLRHVLVGDPFHVQFMRTVSGVGGSLLRARPAHVANIEIPIPPLREQRRIAEVLDRAEALRASRRDTLVQLGNLIQAIFLEMFGDPAKNLKGWPVCSIGSLLESASYGTSEKSESTGSFPVLRMNNIDSSGNLDLRSLKFMDLDASLRERYLVRQGDLLFNRTNSPDLVGKTAVFREEKPMAYAGYLIRLRTNAENDPEYISAFLNSKFAKRVLRGMCKSIIGMANINATEIQAMKIPQPPASLQRRFASNLGAVEKLKAIHRASLAQFDALFASLQQRAFRGDL